jgi:acetyltransferase-like isoleucine patch superfamily enzyme
MNRLSLHFLIGKMRPLLWKTRLGARLRIVPLRMFMDAGVRLVAEGNARIRCAHGVHLDRYVTIKAGPRARIDLGADVYLNESSRIVARSAITIDEKTMIADAVSIFDHDHRFIDARIPMSAQGFACAPITIGRDVWIGSHAVLCKGITIGDHAIVAAGAVVTRDVAPYAVAMGVPAREVRKRSAS